MRRHLHNRISLQPPHLRPPLLLLSLPIPLPLLPLPLPLPTPPLIDPMPNLIPNLEPTILPLPTTHKLHIPLRPRENAQPRRLSHTHSTWPRRMSRSRIFRQQRRRREVAFCALNVHVPGTEISLFCLSLAARLRLRGWWEAGRVR